MTHAGDDHRWRHSVAACQKDLESTTEVAVAHIGSQRPLIVEDELLNTCIIGCTAARVDSSRIDMLAGLSKCDSLRMPPCFWAKPGAAFNMAKITPPARAAARNVPIMPAASSASASSDGRRAFFLRRIARIM